MQNKLTVTFNKMITSDQFNLIDHIHFAYDQNDLHAKTLPVTRFEFRLKLNNCAY